MNISCSDLILRKKSGFIVIFLFLLISLQCKDDQPVAPIVLSSEIVHVSQYGGSDGSIDLTVIGGWAPFAFLWSTGDTLEDLTGIPAGIYTVRVTDRAFQTAIDTFEVMQPQSEGVIDIDGNYYNIIAIGDQTWMKENLRVRHAPDGTAITGYAYIDKPDSIRKYGLLYTWDVAMNGSKEESAQGICPDGWHLPSDDEWKQLEMALGMTKAQADITDNWRGSPVGTMLKAGGTSGYEAPLAGRCISGSSFALMGRMEYIWTSTEYGNNYAWRRCLDRDSPAIGRYKTFPKTYGFSVRCVKDD